RFDGVRFPTPYELFDLVLAEKKLGYTLSHSWKLEAEDNVDTICFSPLSSFESVMEFCLTPIQTNKIGDLQVKTDQSGTYRKYPSLTSETIKRRYTRLLNTTI